MARLIQAAATSWRSSLLGFIGGVALYVYTSGVKLPQTKDDVWHFVFAAIVAGGGLVTKDNLVTGAP